MKKTKKRVQEKWKPGEIVFLETHPHLTSLQVAEILGRSRSSVRTKRANLKNPRPVFRVGAPPGERHGLAVLTEEKVREMRRVYAEGKAAGTPMSILKIAVDYNVAVSTAGHALSGRTWSHVE